MFKDLKENLKNISEIVGMISVAGMLIAIITSVLYDFGYFYYFSVYIWNLPISFSEILKDCAVVFPKLLLVFILSLIPVLFLVAIFIFCPTKKKIINNAIGNALSIIFVVFILSLFIEGFNIHPFFFYILFIFFIFEYEPEVKDKKGKDIFRIILVIFVYVWAIISSGLYESKYEFNKTDTYKDFVVMKDKTMMDNVKILRAYDKGIIVIENQNNVTFLYTEDIKKYSIYKGNKNFLDIIRFCYNINLLDKIERTYKKLMDKKEHDNNSKKEKEIKGNLYSLKVSTETDVKI